MVSESSEYCWLAAKFAINSHRKNCPDTFSDFINLVTSNGKSYENNYKNFKEIYEKDSFIDKDIFMFVNLNKDYIDKLIIHANDNLLDYFGFNTLKKGYLIK